MGIEFHCTHCSKLIRAPDTHGGKRGKCPYCKGSVYVPTPPEQLEEIPLSPVDENDERQKAELEAEARRLAADLVHEDQDPSQRGASTQRGAGWSDVSSEDEASPDIGPLVIRFVHAMQASLLEEADQIVEELRPYADRVKVQVQALMVDEIPLAGLEKLPPGLYKGFLRTLLERL
ncbi:MAG TPA: hypothetical protein VM243_02270 [Phycisphaerae bacterium]|nr:hypothetical protein [Phycisphaerae bacterium]